MIGKYQNHYYHVSDEVDDSGYRTIWRFGSFGDLKPADTYAGSTVYEKNVPDKAVTELIEYLRFTAKWKGERVTIQNITRSPIMPEKYYAVIESYNSEFARNNDFSPYQTDRGLVISWRKRVPLICCRHVWLEKVLHNGSIINRELSDEEFKRNFCSMVLELRDPPVKYDSVPRTVGDGKNAQGTKETEVAIQNALVGKVAYAMKNNSKIKSATSDMILLPSAPDNTWKKEGAGFRRRKRYSKAAYYIIKKEKA